MASLPMTESTHATPSIHTTNHTEPSEPQRNGVNHSKPAPSTNTSPSHTSLNITPLWSMMDKMVPPTPNPRAIVTSWPYNAMAPELAKACTQVTAAEAERRVLILVNQAMKPPFTTDTIYSGLQAVMPGEVAPAHRHRAFALRFIISGNKGYTAVEGRKIYMRPGDVILTPSWTWHDHGNEGQDEPVIWLDGLDLPLWQFLPINFLEHYSEERYPSEPVEESDWTFPWCDVQKVLDVDKDTVPHATYQYRRKGSDKYLSKTISAQAERVSRGCTTEVSLEVYSYVYHVYKGRGYTLVSNSRTGETERVEWQEKDTFAVPAWSGVSHTCVEGGDGDSGNAYLFAISDRPIVEALTFARF